jgi:hypothetical protein
LLLLGTKPLEPETVFTCGVTELETFVEVLFDRSKLPKPLLAIERSPPEEEVELDSLLIVLEIETGGVG